MMKLSAQLLTIGQLAALSLLSDVVSAQNATTNATLALIAQQEALTAYGHSPPVYPSPQGPGTGDWAAAYAYARNLVAQMTNEEKENMTIGYVSTTNGCSGNSGPVTRVGFPGLCLNDAAAGVRGTDGTSGYASGIHVGAAWNRNLAYNRAQYLGAEFKAKGVNVALGPVVGPIGRVATGGRNWEGFTNDPWLAGELTSETIRGLQESVIACTKHFVAYEQETDRNPPTAGPDAGLNVSVSSNLDDKTMHELYLWPFANAVKAGTGSVMCSYNRINGSYACQNSKTMNGLLKTELGFEGFVVSDWYGQHTGIASAEAGLDMAMPDSPFWSGNLTLAVSNGTLSQERLDDMVTRIIATWYKLNPLQDPGNGVPVDLTAPHKFTSAIDPASKSTIFQGAVEGHVLVKNVNNALPLKAPKALSLFGYDGPIFAVNDLDAKWSLGYEGLNITVDEVYELFLVEANLPAPEASYGGTMISGGGSGAVTPAYINAPYDAFQQQAYEDGTWLAWDFSSQEPSVDGGSDACIVFINEFASEGFDRPGLADPYSDTLVTNVASVCNNTIVVIHNAGIRTVEAFVDNPNVTAIVYAHLPGQDSGRSLVEVMYGFQSFSGRLPYTVAKQASDYGDLLEPAMPDVTSDYYLNSNFTEGVYIDYKSFIARNITPRYEFGFGLTYSTFSYSNLRTNMYTNVSHTYLPPNATTVEGGNPTLWDVLATVDVSITNTGSVAAAEVAQLYVGIPGGPPKVLRGFNKQGLEPNQTVDFHFELQRRDLSSWNTGIQNWVLQAGSYPIYVGKSVLDIQLTGTLTV